MRLDFRSALGELAQAIRALIGAPDYDRYVEHVTERHPEQVPLTREQFTADRLTNRYNRPGSRCC